MRALSPHRQLCRQRHTAGQILDGGGLVLAVRKSGTRPWLFRYQRNGIARGMGLGSLRNTSRRKRGKGPTRRGASCRPDRSDQRPHRPRQQEAAAPRNCAPSRGRRAVPRQEPRALDERGRLEASLDQYVHPIIGNIAIADLGVPHVLKWWRRIGTGFPKPRDGFWGELRN